MDKAEEMSRRMLRTQLLERRIDRSDFDEVFLELGASSATFTRFGSRSSSGEN